MPGPTKTLKKFQVIDSELFRLKRAKETKPLELQAAEQRLNDEEGKLKEFEDHLKSFQLEQKKKEGELQTREDQIKKLKGQLMQLKTNREYTTMQHEIDTIVSDNSLMEEVIIGILDRIDVAAEEKKAQESIVKEQRASLVRETTRIEQDLIGIDQEIGRLDRDRKIILPEIDTETLSVYERILDIREGLALVAVAGESCGGCDRRLPPQVLNQVYLNADLVTCETCNRILYKAEDV